MNIHRPGCHLKHVICTFSPFALLSLTHLDYLPNIIALLLNYFYLLYANTDCTSFVKVSVKNGTETAETESWKRRKRKSCVKLVTCNFMWCLKVICFKLRFPFGISSAWLPRFMVCFLLLSEFIIKHASGAVLQGAVDKETRMRKLDDAAFQMLKSNEHIDYRIWILELVL